MALGDQIWREEIVDNIDYVESLTLTINNVVDRARYQRAPPALVDRLTGVRDHITQALDELRVIVDCFPREP
jgi:hypothetical protein